MTSDMLRPSLLIGLSLIVLSLVQPTEVTAESAAGRQIERILTQVQAGLIKAQKRIKSPKRAIIQKVVLELRTEVGAEGSTGLNLFVISADMNIANSRVQTITLTLVPPTPATSEPATDPKLSDALADAIANAINGIQSAEKRNPPLLLASLEVELKFVLEKSGGGGIDFTLTPVNFGLKGEVSEASTQKILVIISN